MLRPSCVLLFDLAQAPMFLVARVAAVQHEHGPGRTALRRGNFRRCGRRGEIR